MKYNNLIHRIFLFTILSLGVGHSGDAQIQMSRSVISAGAVDASGQDLRLTGTVGQAFIGISQTGDAEGRLGFWEQVVQINTEVREIPGLPGDNEALIGSIYPNPAPENARVKLNLPGSELVEAYLLDKMGRRVANIYRGQLPSGRYELDFETAELPAGTYTLLVVAGESVGIGQLVVAR